MSCNSTGGGSAAMAASTSSETVQTESASAYIPSGLTPWQAQYYQNFMEFAAEAEDLEVGSVQAAQRAAEIISNITSAQSAHQVAAGMLNMLNQTPYDQIGTPGWNKAVAQYRMMQAAGNYLDAIGG